MITLDLDEAERDIFAHILETDLSDLRMEIADSDRLEYREALKRKKAVLHKVLAVVRLGA